jgi:surfeit locus 1 family protein
LIARVQERVHAPAVPAPAVAEWPRINAANSEYRHVRVSGIFLNDSETLVQALTELGGGFWVLTPLRQADGSVVLVNRGFVPPERRARAAHGAGEATTAASLAGLLRISEPGGSFLQRNDPAQDRWYSRDVQAIAAARGLTHVAPYFIDADAQVSAQRPAGDTGPPEVDGAAPAASSDRRPDDAAGSGEASAQGGGSRAEVDSPHGAAAPAASGDRRPDDVAGSGAVGDATQGAAASGSAAPVGGLTVVSFRNAHLSYAITWYALALLVVVATWIAIREERRHA